MIEPFCCQPTRPPAALGLLLEPVVVRQIVNQTKIADGCSAVNDAKESDVYRGIAADREVVDAVAVALEDGSEVIYCRLSPIGCQPPTPLASTSK